MSESCKPGLPRSTLLRTRARRRSTCPRRRLRRRRTLRLRCTRPSRADRRRARRRCSKRRRSPFPSRSPTRRRPIRLHSMFAFRMKKSSSCPRPRRTRQCRPKSRTRCIREERAVDSSRKRTADSDFRGPSFLARSREQQRDRGKGLQRRAADESMDAGPLPGSICRGSSHATFFETSLRRISRHQRRRRDGRVRQQRERHHARFGPEPAAQRPRPPSRHRTGGETAASSVAVVVGGGDHRHRRRGRRRRLHAGLRSRPDLHGLQCLRAVPPRLLASAL